MNFYAITGSGRGPDEGSSPSSSSSTPSSSNHPHPPDIFCELCFTEVDDAVPIQSVAEGSMMTKMMRNLCHHIQLPSSTTTTLPDILPPGEIVPLCGECVQVIKTLWDLQCLIEKAVNKMERTVVDSKILFPNKESENPGSNGYVLRLREVILEGYCAKLKKNQQERNNQAVDLVGFDNHNHQQQVYNPGGDGDDSSVDDDVEGGGEIRGSTSTSDAICALLSSIGNDFSEGDEGEQGESLNANDDDGSQDEGEEIYMDANGFGYHGQQTQQEGVDDGQRTVQAQKRVDYDEEVEEGDDDYQGKQEEPLLPTDDDYDGNKGEGAEDEGDDVFIIERNKSPLTIKGVEVYELTTGSKPNVRYLQCGSCNFKLSIPDPDAEKGAKESGLAEVQMKSHVHIWHKRANKAAKVLKIGNVRTITRSRKPTSGRRALAVPSIECDICLRPLPANRPQNLLLHKFSRMNEAEQQKTLATGGKNKSCFNSLTRKRRTEGNSRGTTEETGIPAAKKSRRTCTKLVKKNVDNAASELKFPCPVCNRSFKGKNYLTLHLKTHGKLMRKPPSPSPRFERGSKEEFLYSIGLVRVQKKPEQN